MSTLLKKIDEFYERYDYVKNKDELLLFVIKMILLKFLVDKKHLQLDGSNSRCLKNNFTVNQMMLLWKKSSLAEDFWYDENKLPLSTVIWNDVLSFIDGESFLEIETNLFGMIYEECLHRSHQKSQGIFYTPVELSDYMAEICISTDKQERILDPACGSGSLLSAVYDYILNNTKAMDKEIIHMLLLKKLIYGVDKDPLAVLVTKLTLILKGEHYVFPANIHDGDSLQKETDLFGEIRFDVIIGNPPYVGHKEIDSDYMKALKIDYQTVYQNKSDLSYCFFERGYTLLTEGGRLLFLTSRYFMEAYNARGLRRFIQDHFKIAAIIDFNGLRVIEGVGIDPALTLLIKEQSENHKICVSKFHVQKGKLKNKAVYIDDLKNETHRYYETFEIKQSILQDDLWRLYGPLAKDIIDKIDRKTPFTLDNVVDSFQGIITGNDKVFIFDTETLRGSPFNPEFLHPWIKNKDVQPFYIKPAQKTILYTNEMKCLEEYPYEEVYLKQFKEKLNKRRECKTGKLPWYAVQWGRNPEIFKRKKIVFPYKATKSRFAIDDNHYFFSADIYGLTLKERIYNHMNEEFLVLLLNSKLYNFYFQSFAKKLGVDLYEYYPNTLLKLRIPDVDVEISSKFKELYDRITNLIQNKQIEKYEAILAEVDRWFYNYFEINEEEISQLENGR
ncbi:MAG: N-6 DNA methylase [Eubacterium sp.]